MFANQKSKEDWVCNLGSFQGMSANVDSKIAACVRGTLLLDSPLERFLSDALDIIFHSVVISNFSVVVDQRGFLEFLLTG